MTADTFRTALLSYAGRLDKRALETIDLVVIHCTELPDLQSAREYGERIHHPGSDTGNCGHLYIDRDGSIESWVSLDRVAHHARGYNERSIGIELVNDGRWPDWFNSANQVMSDSYPEIQIKSLLRLLDELQRELPALRWIAGHEDLDLDQRVFRKRDPGPLFPWQRILASSPLAKLQD
jgi:N-acetylmuramoyl-L-alanine amidase